MVQGASEKEQDILLQFPTVYIHNWKNTGDYEVYIGESNNIIQRTKQHYESGVDEKKWQHQLLQQDASLYIIGHEHFNKSMTLDIENRLMLYMMSVDRVRKIHNLRGNPQSSIIQIVRWMIFFEWFGRNYVEIIKSCSRAKVQ